MREILFRAKEAKRGKWIEGFYCPCVRNGFPATPCIIENEKLDVGLWSPEKIIPETVGQFTGLTDKNGTKIFEGDIVNWYSEILVVKFGEYNAIEQSYEIGNHFRNVDKFGWFGERQSCFSKGIDLILLNAGEIIGNIHDNPELLEVE